MRLGTVLLTVALIGALAPGLARAEESAPLELVLPDYLLEKLLVEMNAISDGMGELLTQLSMGHTEGAADVAAKIRDTFILKQELSQEELSELVSLLPAGFITMDRAFHGTAGKLSAAAASGDFETAIQHYTTMSQACVTCHAEWAAKRFPTLVSED
jgi:hypothetical protein